MKKTLLATFMVVGLCFTSASAGWINTGGYACNPSISEPGTCSWVEDPLYRGSVQNESDYLQMIKTFVKINLFLPF